MTIFDLIAAARFPGIPRMVYGTCSARTKDEDEIDRAKAKLEDELQQRKERQQAMRKSRARRREGLLSREAMREQRREKIMAFLKTLTQETAMTELQIATHLNLPKTTVSYDMKDLFDKVNCAGMGKIRRVYWL